MAITFGSCEIINLPWTHATSSKREMAYECEPLSLTSLDFATCCQKPLIFLEKKHVHRIFLVKPIAFPKKIEW